MNILPLRDAVNQSATGGKAANLARLIALGAPVPDGFVLTNSALQHFVAEQEALPPHVDIEVMTAWQLLSPGPVIVRSSAVGEDSSDASFAGQLDSVAGITSESQLRAAILQVWSSQWSARALAYQSARDTFLADMAIVIQRQIEAQVSGVLFTRSPNSASHMLLEYCEGRGEALVSGAVNPGRVAIARRDFRWKQEATPDHAFAGETRLLNDIQLSSLTRLALKIERTFGAPQDIEWTIDAQDKLWIVQSRPITTIRDNTEADRPNATDESHPLEADVLWSNANVNENFPQPISPLLYSVARAGYYHYFRNLGRAFGVSARRLQAMEPALRQIIGVHGARMYYNLTSIHGVLRSAPFGDLLAASFNQFVGAEDSAANGRGATRHARAYQAFEVAVITVKTAWQYLFLTKRVEEFERTVESFAAQTDPKGLQSKSQAALQAALRDFMDIRCNRWKNASLADAGSMVCYGVLQRLLAQAFPAVDQQALHNTLLKALPDLVSSVPALKMWELSRMIRQDEALHRLLNNAGASDALEQIESDDRFADFRAALQAYLDGWGFRCSAELMLTVPSFQEDPAPLIDLLRAYADMDGESPADLLRRQSDERVSETARVLADLRSRKAWWVPFSPFALVVRTLLGWTQRSIQLRERARLKQALLYSRLRRVSLAMGERFTAAGRLERSDDIFFLSIDEVDLIASGGEMFPEHVSDLVALRREAHARSSADTPPDSMCLRPGEYFESSRTACTASAPGVEKDAQLKGVGACGGSKTATAAILLDVTDSHLLRPGDILVTRQTDPGWGPIFPLISGLVIERGGMLSHGAIIAREFGIPSVVGVRDATRLIPHGGAITVDGDRGLVHLAARTAQ
jgi:rifampicin phosphotransferase